MIKAIALDDEPPALEVIKSFCALTDYIELVKTFTRVEEAEKYLAEFAVDLIFLDINMPSVSGIDFTKQLGSGTMVIFTTAYSEFALEGFNLNAVDYLLKPIPPERFMQAAQKAKAYYHYLHPDMLSKTGHILIRVNYILTRILLSDILFIEGLDDYLKINLQGQKPVVTRMTMKNIMEKLPHGFIRVHRSYIVPLSRIEAVNNKHIQIRGDEIPIGVSYEKKFYEVFRK
jgi:DNA-binding LytR/AlgR family response regulator